MNVEMVVPALETGGMEVMVERLLIELRSRGHRVGVSCLYGEGEVADRLRSIGVDVEYVHSPGTLSNAIPRRLAARLRRRQVDVVHAHTGAWLKAARAAQMVGCRRVVLTSHGLMDRETCYTHLHMRLAAHIATAVVAVSKPLLAYLSTSAGLNPNRLHFVANGVSSSDFTNTPERRRDSRAMLGITTDQSVVVCVARLVPVKRHDVLLNAISLLQQQIPHARLFIAGDGPERAALQSLAAALVPAGAVTFLGNLSDPRPVLWSADAFVLCSDSEGQPMAMLEAMAAGVPIVASAVGGIPETLGPALAGSLFPPGDHAQCSMALAGVLTDTRHAAQLSALASARAQDFSFDRTVTEYEQLYEIHAA